MQPRCFADAFPTVFRLASLAHKTAEDGTEDAEERGYVPIQPPTWLMPRNSNSCSSSVPSPTIAMASIWAWERPAARRYLRSALLSWPQ